MTDEELTAIKTMMGEYFKQENTPTRDQAKTPRGVPVYVYIANDLVGQALPTLLAEVEAWREIGRVVADGRLYYTDQPQGWWCVLCGEWTNDEWGHGRGGESESDRAKRVIEHDDDCPVTKARALLNHPAASNSEQ